MQDESGFLHALGQDPHDDETRLVYADWLEERGDARAEFLRLDHQLGQLLGGLDELRGQIDPAWLARVRRPGADSSRIELHTGRQVQIKSIRQWFTYAGLEVGLPNERFNRELVERVLREERGRGSWAGEPYLVPPTVRPIKWDAEYPYPFGTPEEFPGVTCVACLESLSPARDASMDLSALTVIWFQDAYAFPIDPQVLAHLRALDWDARAIDLEY
jgi:uncharacterized protein (TIGR02996 family)